ncbi:MAG: phosphoribosylaminoimidazolesuccinocarboxamide synthase [Thermodesulfobacteriota bacterium]
MTKMIIETDIDGLGPVSRGKVRDIYDLGKHLLIVTTDRVSAFDVVLPNGIPNKGIILTGLSEFWFNRMEDMVPHHLISTKVADFPAVCQPYADQLKDRSMLVKKTTPLPVECIVRGYLSGSGWREYCTTGRVCGMTLPEGLKESGKLPEPIFTPSTKADKGDHDVNISFNDMKEMTGAQIAHQVKALSLAVYCRAQAFAEKQGIIIADTKLEFGILDGKLILIDEILTPDSSRFWPLNDYSPGRPQKSMDKQFVRDYLTSVDWHKNEKLLKLPLAVVNKTSDIYLNIFHILTSSD